MKTPSPLLRPRLLLAAGLLNTTAAFAAPDFSVTPSVNLAAAYDDNIFLAVNRRQSDLIMRLTPGISVDSKIAELTLQAIYHQDLEYYSDHSELDSTSARQSAELRAGYQPTRGLGFDVHGSYQSAPTPGELNLLDGAGLQNGRVDSTRRAAGASVSYVFTPRMNGSVGYNETRSKTDSGIGGGDTREGLLNFSRALTATTTLLLGDIYREFIFDNVPNVHSNTPLIGVYHEFGPRSNIRVQGGPRRFEDSVKPEIQVALQHQLARSLLVFNYSRSESVLAGVNGKVETELADFSWSRPITGKLSLNIKPAYGTITSELSSAKVYRVDTAATYRLSELLTLVGSWQYTHQREALTGFGPSVVPHNIFMISLNLAFPSKQERL